MKVKKDVLLSELITFKTSGKIKNLVVVESLEELQKIVKEEDSFFILGRGSNTLINEDTDVQTIIKLSSSIFPVDIKNTIVRFNAVSIERKGDQFKDL